MSSILSDVVWVDESTAAYLRWKFKNTTDPDLIDLKEAAAGVYICGEYSNDFLTRRVFRKWFSYITDPFTIKFIAFMGFITSKSFSPIEIAKNVAKEFIQMFIMFLVFYIVIAVPVLILDLLITVPFMLINMNAYNNRKYLSNPSTEEAHVLSQVPVRLLLLEDARSQSRDLVVG